MLFCAVYRQENPALAAKLPILQAAYRLASKTTKEMHRKNTAFAVFKPACVYYTINTHKKPRFFMKESREFFDRFVLFDAE